MLGVWAKPMSRRSIGSFSGHSLYMGDNDSQCSNYLDILVHRRMYHFRYSFEHYMSLVLPIIFHFSRRSSTMPKRQVSFIQYTMRSLYIHFATVGPSAYFNRCTARDVFNTINTQSHTETAHASRRKRPRKGSQTTKNGFRRH